MDLVYEVLTVMKNTAIPEIERVALIQRVFNDLSTEEQKAIVKTSKILICAAKDCGRLIVTFLFSFLTQEEKNEVIICDDIYYYITLAVIMRNFEALDVFLENLTPSEQENAIKVRNYEHLRHAIWDENAGIGDARIVRRMMIPGIRASLIQLDPDQLADIFCLTQPHAFKKLALLETADITLVLQNLRADQVLTLVLSEDYESFISENESSKLLMQSIILSAGILNKLLQISEPLGASSALTQVGFYATDRMSEDTLAMKLRDALLGVTRLSQQDSKMLEQHEDLQPIIKRLALTLGKTTDELYQNLVQTEVSPRN